MVGIDMISLFFKVPLVKGQREFYLLLNLELLTILKYKVLCVLGKERPRDQETPAIKKRICYSHRSQENEENNDVTCGLH